MTNFRNEDCAVVIQSCDNYHDVWPLFFAAFKHNWPDCQFDIYLNTETKNFKFDGLDILTISETDSLSKPWGKRLTDLVRRIDKPYIISLFDDFLLEKPVQYLKIFECLEILKRDHEIAAFYFLSIPGAIRSDGAHPDFNLVEGFTDYKINSAPAIWRKSSLLKFTGDNDTPWAWEVFGTARTYFEKDRFYSVKDNESLVFPYQYALGGGIRRGKWVASVVEPLMEKHGITIDLNRRGIASESLNEGKHSLKWKLNFLLLGYQLVGARAVVFILRAIYQKLRKRYT